VVLKSLIKICIKDTLYELKNGNVFSSCCTLPGISEGSEKDGRQVAVVLAYPCSSCFSKTDECLLSTNNRLGMMLLAKDIYKELYLGMESSTVHVSVDFTNVLTEKLEFGRWTEREECIM
jgi:hypothetical protein